MSRVENDAKRLIFESFRMEGITLEECRSIFVDWALSLDAAIAPKQAISELIEEYQDVGAHPMMDVLAEGLAEPVVKGRRGGWAGRRAGHKP